MPIIKTLAFTAFAFGVMGPALAAGQGIDYHTHIVSPGLAQRIVELDGDDAGEYTAGVVANGTGADEILPLLENGPFGQAVILSLAYFAAYPVYGFDSETQKTITRQENTYNAAVAAQSSRIHSFFSVSPIAEYALVEARFWLEQGGHAGLKLHLANAHVDLMNADHVSRIQSLFRLVNDPGMILLIHLRNRGEGYGVAEMEVFIDELLPHLKQARVILAHAAGWGGYDKASDESLEALINAMAEGRVDRTRLYLDVASVLDPDLPAARRALFLQRFRSIPLYHWVFGSDWSPGFETETPGGYLEALKQAGLTGNEADALISNQAPFMAVSSAGVEP